MNINEPQPHNNLILPQGNLVVDPKSGFDELLKQFNEKMVEFEQKVDDLYERLQKKGLPSMKGMVSFTPKDFIQYQLDHGGCYTVPFDCYIEVDKYNQCFSLWVDPPNNDPVGWYNAKKAEHQANKTWTTANKRELYRQMCDFKLMEGGSSDHRGNCSAFLYEGQRVVITWAFHHSYANFKKATEIEQGDGNYISFIRFLPLG